MAESDNMWNEIIKDLRAEFKKTGDKELLKMMQGGEQAKRRAQMSGEARSQIIAVRSHIERRAELRERTAIKFPNIAGILTGGAESPIAGLGRMQRAASKPFKGVYEYKKSEAEMRRLGKIPKDKRTEEEQMELERIGGELPGKKKRAESGFGGNLMGKRMQGMIGKVGKFMESSKGQGMMAGGMMGASILTMVIKKAMEASPMLQAMFKIMNTALTLFLRPIGDFIGGMLKPITMFFLREIAIPMLKKGKDFIKFGEAFGKSLLGFLLKPIETIQAAITAAIPGMPEDMRKLAENFDGMKAWMSEQKMNVLASEMGLGSREELIELIKTAKGGEALSIDDLSYGGMTTAEAVEKLKAIEAEFGTGFIPTLQRTVPPLDTFRQLMTDVNENTYTYVNTNLEAMKTSSLAVATGMGVISGTFASVVEEGDLLAGTFERINDALGTGGQTPGATPEDPIPTTGPMQDYPKKDEEQRLADIEKAAEKAAAHWSDVTVYDTVGKMFAAAGMQIRTGLQAKAGSAEYIQARKEYGILTGKSPITGKESQTIFQGIQDKFKELSEASGNWIIATTGELEAREDLLDSAVDMGNAASQEKYIRENMVDGIFFHSLHVLNTGEKIVGNYVGMAQESEKGLSKMKSIIENMASQISSGGGGGRNSNPWSMSNMIKSGTTLEALGRHVGAMQHGGVINEPIWGIGKSGQTYTFGEAGSELVTPMTGGKNSLGNITANITVNIEKVLQDVDLEQIKPIVERALLEVHSRRGII